MKFAVFEVHVHFAVGPLEVLVLLISGPWRNCTEQRGGGAGISGEESRRRRGESGGKWRGARELPLGGRGSSGEGRRRRVRGEGRPAVGLIAGGHAPVREGGSGWVGELQEGDGVPFQGSN